MLPWSSCFARGFTRLPGQQQFGLHLCEATIHEQFRSCNVATVVGGEEHHGPGDLIGGAESAERNSVGQHLQALLAGFCGSQQVVSPGVSVAPGLTAFTRMRRCFKSVVQVRANERTAALVALETRPAPNPLLAPMAAFRMIEAPSESNGSAFCTVKSMPFTLTLKIES